MENPVLSVTVDELESGYKVTYRGTKEYLVRNYGSRFSPLGAGQYGASIGPVRMIAVETDSGFELELIGPKEMIKAGFLKKISKFF